MSIRYAGHTIVGPGNEIYIGHNGNFFCGLKDLGVRAKSDVEIVSEAEFDAEYRSGLYYVVTPSATGSGTPDVTLWYIDDLGNKKAIVGNSYIIPEIGPNGNWFINGTDTGKPSVLFKQSISKKLFKEDWNQLGVTDLYYQNISVDGMNSGDEIVVKLDISDDILSTIDLYLQEFNLVVQFIPNTGYMRAIASKLPNLTLPITITFTNTSSFGSFEPGAAIDDDSVNKTTTWSSQKINDFHEEFIDKVNVIQKGKNLEFTWAGGTHLGVRQEGYEEYQFANLKGATGLCGIDGSSIVEAQVDESGHLLVTLQDTDAPVDTTKMLTLETGVFTGSDLLNLQNSINRLNNSVAALTTAPFSQIYKYDAPTEDYITVAKLSGFGNVQLFSTKFTGSFRITTDEYVFTGTFNDMSLQSENNLIVPSHLDNTVKMNYEFASGQNYPLRFVFEESAHIEIRIDDNIDKVYPDILLQGDYYDNTDYGEDGGNGDLISNGSITEQEIVNAFAEIFGA